MKNLAKQTHKVRIIAGNHKGRRVDILDRPGLRPSPDRVRETLFNWLQFLLSGAHILDAFAGSGVMGLEALSRGASSAIFFEKDPQIAQQISQTLTQWRENHASVKIGDALSFSANRNPFDLIFIDPPFMDNLHQQALDKFSQSIWLKDNGLLYIETPFALTELTLPPNTHWHKQSKAGRLHFGLIKRDAHA